MPGQKSFTSRNRCQLNSGSAPGPRQTSPDLGLVVCYSSLPLPCECPGGGAVLITTWNNWKKIFCHLLPQAGHRGGQGGPQRPPHEPAGVGVRDVMVHCPLPVQSILRGIQAMWRRIPLIAPTNATYCLRRGATPRMSPSITICQDGCTGSQVELRIHQGRRLRSPGSLSGPIIIPHRLRTRFGSCHVLMSHLLCSWIAHERSIFWTIGLINL